MKIESLPCIFGLSVILVCQLSVINAMMINRLNPKPDQGFQVQLNLTKNEPFWWDLPYDFVIIYAFRLCFGYVPANHSHHHSFRWDKCTTDERHQSLNGHHGFAYAIHGEWDTGLLSLKFWRAEITDQDYMLINNANIPDSHLTITHSRGITVFLFMFFSDNHFLSSQSPTTLLNTQVSFERLRHPCHYPREAQY